MKDLSHPTSTNVKGLLVLLLGLISGMLLLVTIWAFCRFNFFDFHVLQDCVDPGFRHSGLGSLFLYFG